MARSLRLLAAIPLLSWMVMPALASGRYQVQPRDSFYGIARKCQVDVYELMRLNPRPGDALKLGEQLRLPANARCGNAMDSAGAAATDTAYQVQPRDSFYSIARKCQVDVYELMRLNPRPGDALKLGEQLRLPGNARCSSGAGSAGATGTDLAYQVQPREGFYSIARKCQVDAKELMRLNSASGVALKPGQQLTLPANARCPAQTATVASSTSTPRSTATTPTQGTVTGTLSYQVQPHEGFYSIAQKCQVDTRELIRLNPDIPSVLSPGLQLKLPGNARCPAPSTTTDVASAGTKSYYEVQPREGFSSIARKCQVDAKALMLLNPRPNDNILYVGEQLELPGGAQCESVVAANPDAAASSAATSAANIGDGATVDSGWRSYGDLKVNWQEWQMVEGHWVAKSMNSSGQPLYLAINCPARRMNKTSSNGEWSTWDVPDPGFEERLMNDLCQEKKDQG